MRALVLVALLLALFGCGRESTLPSSYSESTFESQRPTIDSAAYSKSEASTSTPAGKSASSGSEATKTPSPSRREIIYSARIDLVVDDFVIGEKKIRELANKYDATIANYQGRQLVGSEKLGEWVLRVAAANFHAMVSDVESLGTSNNSSIQGQDVSEEYVDLQARLTNQLRFEKELIELLDARQGPLKEVLEIQRELANVREAIERLEGRLRFLNDRITLSTITIALREGKIYQDKQPTFATRLDEAWSKSVSKLGRLAETLSITAVASLPWVLVALIFIAPPMVVVNFRRRQKISSDRHRLTESK